MVNGEKLTFIKDSDLYCLFGNIIDNAIDAVSSVSDEEKRIINLTTKSQGNMLIIQQDNYFDGTLNFVDGLPETTKKDKINHGYGMKSIRMITHSYGGEMVVKADNNMFNLSILLDCE